MGGHTIVGVRWRSPPASLATRYRWMTMTLSMFPVLMDHLHLKVAYEGRCRGQGGEFILPPDTAAIEAEEEEECPDTCGFNYAPVCGTGGNTRVKIECH